MFERRVRGRDPRVVNRDGVRRSPRDRCDHLVDSTTGRGALRAVVLVQDAPPLVVAEHRQGIGVGKKLVTACVERARQRNILEVMVVTSSDVFFQSCGFDFTLPGEKKALFLQPHLTD